MCCYDIHCPACEHEFEYEAIKPAVWNFREYENGFCPNCGEEFEFDDDGPYPEPVTVPWFINYSYYERGNRYYSRERVPEENKIT